MSRSEHSTQATGGHRTHRRAPRSGNTRPQRPPARYEPYLDGLFTYCLSVLCEHDAAAATLGDVLAVAERRRGRGRGRAPAEGDLCRPWLYAVARWACLRKLAELKERREYRGIRDWRAVRGRGDAGPDTSPGSAETIVPAVVDAELPEPIAAQRRRELAALAWPEAAGTTAEQREALELAVRHQLTHTEVAAALGKEPDATRALLASAACEVERTRAALAVVELGHCPVVARLAGDTQVLLSAALRRELVRHVDDCRECRRMAERATADGPWPGTAAAPAALPLVEAPRAAVQAALLCALSARPARAVAGPRFDRRGFPLDPQDRAARRSRMRSRALTTTVVATVVAAPVLALWAAYRSAPLAGDEHDSDSVAAADVDGAQEIPTGHQRLDGRSFERTGSAQDRSGARARTGHSPKDRASSTTVSVAVIGPDGTVRRYGRIDGEHGGKNGDGRPSIPTSSDRGDRPGGGSGPARPAPGPGRLTVEAQPQGDSTLITLTASGGSPVRWTASTGADWLRMNQTTGVLRPGQTTRVTVWVDREREPSGRWSARVTIGPSGAVVVIEGNGAPPEPTPGPSQSSGTPSPSPHDPSPAPSGTATAKD
ncbi:BACON domain-containing protein [Streptomyces sp. NEAU-Y11]|uniref:BACON domain-containing protein n=1 Tax=Streptomyces cucumeris TaxID=2962890 RepID=UPI0020C84E8A|nr:sigma-70 family RNA polymerase sigma factor [Streptomyces sp. NEAU-Y11]MCP9212107.1 sigma-70 family RNA polymerase sigma factor [Streptomyces sp. NEAU-Y11]